MRKSALIAGKDKLEEYVVCCKYAYNYQIAFPVGDCPFCKADLWMLHSVPFERIKDKGLILIDSVSQLKEILKKHVSKK